MTDLDRHFAAHTRTLCSRYDRALEHAHLDGVVIHAGSLRYRFQDDNPYPFAANPNFVQWAPLTAHPDSWIAYAKGTRPKLIVCLPDDYWHQPPSRPEGAWVNAFDLVVVHTADDAAAALPHDRRHTAFLGEDEGLGVTLGFESINPGQLINAIHHVRACKTDYEIACIREASRLGTLAHVAARDAFFEGESEYGIHSAYLDAIDFTDHDLPYGNIVALNEHGAVLHYQVFDRTPPNDSRSFLIDAGATCRGYASDITRTYARSDGEFAAMIAALDERQQQIVAGCTVGTDYGALHLVAHRHCAELLDEFGLVTGLSTEDVIETGITRAFFPHGLGHLLGIQVHDVAGFSANENGDPIDRPEGHPYLRLTRPLEAGMVTTIEPGLYIIDPLLASLKETAAGSSVKWDRVEEFRPFGGIRIEDDVLVTDAGPVNLTREAFTAIASVNAPAGRP
ncbi:MAG: Xaa-Pro dipeptidase [Pseudomonadota bacterium]